MIGTLTVWEVVLGSGLVLLALSEILQLTAARRQGMTSNVSRLYTHAALLALAVGYIVYTVWWWRAVERRDAVELILEGSTINWTYAWLGLIVALVVGFELAGVIEARRAGRTANVSRLVSHGVMLLVVVVMVGISQVKWDLYLERLADTYRDAIPHASVAD